MENGTSCGGQCKQNEKVCGVVNHLPPTLVWSRFSAAMCSSCCAAMSQISEQLCTWPSLQRR